jgi:hypothetical protein
MLFVANCYFSSHSTLAGQSTQCNIVHSECLTEQGLSFVILNVADLNGIRAG